MSVLDGKSIVITGAGRGLGEAYARLAAQEGARVVVNDIDVAEAERVVSEIRKDGGTAMVSSADISDWDQSRALIDECVSSYGTIDGLINNAGVFHMALPEDEDQARVEQIIRVNINGTINCGLHALRVMRPAGKGAILNVTSGAHAGFPKMALYGATKGAVASVTYGWAADVAGTGVRVNAIAPIARTRMYDQMLTVGDTRDAQTGLDIRPDENAAIAVFLLSDRAEGINGQILRVDIPRLSLITHPAELTPAAISDKWSIDVVEEAFKVDFAGRLQSLGLHTRPGEGA